MGDEEYATAGIILNEFKVLSLFGLYCQIIFRPAFKEHKTQDIKSKTHFVSKIHSYRLSIEWTGNRGTGTSGYLHYDRAHVISVEGKPAILLSSDPSFNGDNSRYNPEELLVASLSSCHMLWYLHLCSVNGVVVTSYADDPEGKMEELPDGSGTFREVVLHPSVIVTETTMIAKAEMLHGDAHKKCFISNSVNFPVKTEAFIQVKT